MNQVKTFDIELPKTLAAKIERVMKDRKISFDDAVFFEIEKVCSPAFSKCTV